MQWKNIRELRSEKKNLDWTFNWTWIGCSAGRWSPGMARGKGVRGKGTDGEKGYKKELYSFHLPVQCLVSQLVMQIKHFHKTQFHFLIQFGSIWFLGIVCFPSISLVQATLLSEICCQFMWLFNFCCFHSKFWWCYCIFLIYFYIA